MLELDPAPPAQQSDVLRALTPRRSTISTLVLAASLLLYGTVGFVPSAFVEGDDAALANGAVDARFAYAPMFQPGMNVATGFLCRQLDWTPGLALAGLCAVGLVAFLMAGATFVSRCTGASTAWSVLALLLMPETLSSAYFGNGTVPALGVTAMALAHLVTQSGSSWRRPALAGALFGIAAWLRLDALLAWPAMVVLGRSPRSRVPAFLAPAMATLTYVVLAAVSGVTLRGLVRYVGEVVDRPPRGAGPFDGLLLWWTFFPLASLLLAFIGCVSRPHAPSPSILVPMIVCFGAATLPWVGTLTSPKHLVFSTPFFAVLVVLGGQHVAKAPWRRKAIAVHLLGLTALQYPLGLRADRGLFSAKLEPTLAEFPVPVDYTGPMTGDPRHISLVLGPSGQVETADSWRPLTGLLYGPASWHHRKVLAAALFENTRSELSAPSQVRWFIADSWLGSQLTQNALLTLGCATDTPLLTASGRATWCCGPEKVHLIAQPSDEGLSASALREILGNRPALLITQARSDPGAGWQVVFRVPDPAVPLALWRAGPRSF